MDVHVRLYPMRLVQRADANESQVGPPAIVAPERDLAIGTAVDVVWPTAVRRHTDRLRLAPEQRDAVGLDQCIDDEGAACLPLAIQAMAAMNEHRLGGEHVAHRAARASARHVCRHGRPLFWPNAEVSPTPRRSESLDA